jgi:hypothetical protein
LREKVVQQIIDVDTDEGDMAKGWEQLCEECADRILALLAEDRRFLEIDRDRYDHALQSLTPGGSEFVRDPERCVQTVTELRRGEHAAMVKAIMDRRKLVEALRKYGKHHVDCDGRPGIHLDGDEDCDCGFYAALAKESLHD